MSPEQVKQTQEILNQIIQDNKKVYTKNSELSLAKNIRGLRAMFDETYPDPVRVVSIGIPVEDLEKNPSDEAAIETSAEFCGGT